MSVESVCLCPISGIILVKWAVNSILRILLEDLKEKQHLVPASLARSTLSVN